MVVLGIEDIGVYIPRYRLGADELGRQWQRRMGKGERAVANHDEDAITMAVAAARACLGDRLPADVDALYFASTTSPYKEKQASAIISTALDMGAMTRTQDLCGSLRAGTGAILAAMDTLKAGSASEVLVVASDCRIPEPGSNTEATLGDGAVAVLLGNKEVKARFFGSVTISEYFMDTWRSDTDIFVRSGDARFGKVHGYVRNTVEAIKAVADCITCQLGEVARYAIYSPDGRSQRDVAKRLGLDKGSVMASTVGNFGMIGCAQPLLLLSAALEGAAPEDKVLVTSYADGSDAVVFMATDSVKGMSVGSALTEEGVNIGPYTKYLSYKGLIKEPEGKMIPFSSSIISSRESHLVIRHHGLKCGSCSSINTLGLRVCPKCGAKDDYTEVPLAKHGRLHTYTQEHYYPNPDGPLTMAVMDLEDGARFLCQMTDVAPEDVVIGMELDLAFRRLHDGGGFHNYCWKSVPVTDGASRHKGGD